MSNSNDQYSVFTFAFVSEFDINEYLAIQPELAFTQKGTMTSSTDYKLRLNYLEMPILAMTFNIPLATPLR